MVSAAVNVAVVSPSSPKLEDARRVAPRVLLLDIDGTVIGRIASAVSEHTVLVLSHEGKDDAASRRAAEKAMRASLVTRLRHGIIRPGFYDFCREVGRPGQAIELFVYTAADDRWAAFIVSCIELAVGVQFNRPLFTRRDCVLGPVQEGPPRLAPLRKSLALVMPVILARLRRKGYGRAVLPDVAALRDRIALIDNTPNVGLHACDTARLIACPSYMFAYNYDVLSMVDVEFLHKRFHDLIPILRRHGLFPQFAASQTNKQPADSTLAHFPMRYQRFCQLYYARLARALRDSEASNIASLRDTFWADLLQALCRHPNAVGIADITAVLAKTKRLVA